MKACSWCGYTTGGHEPLCIGAQTVEAPIEVSRVAAEETRRAARASVERILPDLRRTVLGQIVKAGGATCDEVEVALGLSHQSVSARVNELMEAGLIAAAGRRPTRSGRNAVVWRVA